MTKSLYKFLPNTNVVKGPHALDSPIIIQANNVAFSDYIPKQFDNSGIEDFFDYVKSCTHRYTFCDFLDPFYPKQVCEFYYFCSVDSDAQSISGKIGDGQYRFT
ncbi:unnamed protein product [Lactuca saligna]|uniref:Uncharacterized protein n=1 Tax=Lactuca saligna TaxID=75948 RepID=A0AA35Z4A2_LACSI|nr:unnamed protein product [Lactuca saligna]